MSSLALLQSLKDSILSQASVKAIYGEPIAAEGKTIIPVAKIMYGYGAGAGTGGVGDTSARGEGGGGGGGVRARHWWDVEWRKQNHQAVFNLDQRSGASSNNAWWTGDAGQVAWFLYGYESLWMPASLVCALFCIVHHNLGPFLKIAPCLLGPLVGLVSAMHHGSAHEMYGVFGSVSSLNHHGFRGTINFCDNALD